VKKAPPFFRKKILLSILLPVLTVGIILPIIFVRYLMTPPLVSFIKEKTDTELRLAADLGIHLCEKHMNYLMDLRLENDSEMITALKNEAIGEIKAISKRLYKVNMLIMGENLTVIGSSINLPEEKLSLKKLTGNDTKIVIQEMGGERVLTYSLYFPFWRWHIVGFMYEKDYLLPVMVAEKLIYWGTLGVSGIVAFTLFIVFNWRVTIPLQRIIRATEGAAIGRLEKIEIMRNDEIGQVSMAYNSMAESINTIMSELRESEDKFRNFAEQSLVGINLIQDGVFKYVNPKFAEIFGYTVEQYLNNMKFVELVYPEDLAVVEENVRRRLSGETTLVQYVFRGVKKTGEIIHLEIFGSSCLFNGKPAVTATILDITERKKAEEALRMSEDQIRLLLNSTVEAIYGVDLNGNCTFCNNGCLRMLGYKNADDLIGRNMHRQIHYRHNDGTPFPEEECRMILAIRKGEGAHADDEVLWRADGTCFPAEYWSYPQYSHGMITGSVVTFLDITERKRADEEIRKLAITDTMTGLCNRRGFIALAEQQIKNANRLFKSLSLFFIDVDGLKIINDTMGHEEGDRLLINAANILKQTFRESDIIARVGGDEFAVLADNSEKTTQIVLDRFSERIRMHNSQPDRLYDISMSIGTTAYDPAKPCLLDDLLSQADQLMYMQKKEKTNQKNKLNDMV
jgi:diguanylate cyclase (GGDEF)-like protein/PAS domain S-box-containing protein